MESQLIRLGVVGGGQVGAGTLHHAVELDGVEAVGVVEPDQACRQRLAQTYAVPVYASLEQMLDKAQPDAVKICTPNFMHAVPTIACLNAGVHVLCEKPIATTFADAQGMIEAAKTSGRVFMINFEYRHSLLFSRVKQIIDAGEIGDVRNLWFYESRGAFLGQVGGWRFDPKRSGGLFTEKLCHYIDLAMWYANCSCRRVHVHCGGNTLPHYQLPDQVMAFFEMDDGRSFCLATHHGIAADHPRFLAGSNVFDVPSDQWRRLGHAAGFRIAGSGGALITDDWTGRITVNRLQPVTSEKRGGYGMLHTRCEDLSIHDPAALIHNQRGMLAYFLDAVRRGQALIWPGENQLLAATAAFTAAEQALAQNKPIDIRLEAGQNTG